MNNIQHSFFFFLRSELRDTRNEYDAAEKRLEDAREMHQKFVNEYTQKVLSISVSSMHEFN